MGIKCAYLDNLSSTTNITSSPPDLGNPSMKSSETTAHGRLGMGSGWSSPAGDTRSVFALWHVLH